MASSQAQNVQPSSVGVVVPPVRARLNEKKVTLETVAALVTAIGPEGTWATNGEVYKSYKLASNASQIHRRAVANALQKPIKMIRTRVWETSDAFPPLKRDQPGAWVFALSRKTETPDAPAADDNA